MPTLADWSPIAWVAASLSKHVQRLSRYRFLYPSAVNAACGLTFAAAALAQNLPPSIPTKEELARNNKLFITLASKHLKWEEPAEPVKIVGGLYFVGTQGLGSWLFTTSEGHVLLNPGMPSSGPMIVASIRKLGFRPEDIKIIINGHGHSDHAGAIAFMKQLTGAQVPIMDAEVPLIESGGKSDFHYGADWQIMGQPPVKVDRVLRDGDTVRLGDVLLTAHHTPRSPDSGRIVSCSWQASNF